MLHLILVLVGWALIALIDALIPGPRPKGRRRAIGRGKADEPGRGPRSLRSGETGATLLHSGHSRFPGRPGGSRPAGSDRPWRP